MNADNLYPRQALADLVALEEPGLPAFEPTDLIASSNIPPERIRAFAILEVTDDGYLKSIVEKPAEQSLRRDDPRRPDQHELLALRCADLRRVPARAAIGAWGIRASRSGRPGDSGRRPVPRPAGERACAGSVTARRHERRGATTDERGRPAMTAATLVERLVGVGLPAEELPRKKRSFARVLTSFTDTSAAREGPAQVWWIPGRLEVFGKHTDYAGGRTLVCAIPRGFTLAVRARNDDIVAIVDARSGERARISSTADRPTHAGWAHYVEVVAQRLVRNFPASRIAADIVFASDLPRASGMSSSSALVVGVAAALGAVAQLEARAEWRANIRAPLDVAGYYACLENGRTFGTLQGDAGVGTHGGSEDHAAILTGQPSMLSAFSFVPMRRLADVRVPDDWQFVLAPSGVPSEKTGAARDRYNRLSEGTGRLLQLWNAIGAPASSLAGALSSTPDGASRLRASIDASKIPGWPPAALHARLDHFIREDARIVRALEAFESADVGAVAATAADSQQDAERLIDNQIPATSELVATALDRGAFAASSFGAGFGGSVWALVDRASARTFAKDWDSAAFLANPAPPLTMFPLER